MRRFAAFRVAPTCWRRPGASGGGALDVPVPVGGAPSALGEAAPALGDEAAGLGDEAAELGDDPAGPDSTSRGDSPGSGGRLSAPDRVGCVSSSGWAPVRGGLGRAR
jgi:hypothetical protein